MTSTHISYFLTTSSCSPNESLQNNSGLLCKQYSTVLPSIMFYFTQANIQTPQISVDISVLISVGSWWTWVNQQGGKNVLSPLLLMKCLDFLIRYIYAQIFALVGPLWGNEFQKANSINSINSTLLLYSQQQLLFPFLIFVLCSLMLWY